MTKDLIVGDVGSVDGVACEVFGIIDETTISVKGMFGRHFYITKQYKSLFHWLFRLCEYKQHYQPYIIVKNVSSNSFLPDKNNNILHSDNIDFGCYVTSGSIPRNFITNKNQIS